MCLINKLILSYLSVTLVTSYALSNTQSVSKMQETREGQCTVQIEVKGAIGVGTLDHFEGALERAAKKKCEAILVLINTPGGSLQTTRLIVEAMLNSPVPFLCLVHPSGAHAGSAGAIILQACHVAGAMEATNIGAATPISSTGQDISKDLRKKMLNDTISWLEGITKLRGRDLKFSRDIIADAKAVDATEAYKLGAIDHVAKDPLDFLNFAAGRTVKLSATTNTVVVVGPLTEYEMDIRTHILSLIADPQIAYLMFMGSLGLLYFEITHPGTVVPGVMGGIGLVLSMVSMHKLNVEWGALALILLGMTLMLAEAFVPSFGALGIGGVISFVLGSVFLFDPESSGYSLPLTLIIPTAILMGLLLMGLAYLAFQTRNVKSRSAYDVLLGKEGKVVELASGRKNEGLIEVKGETWKFKSSENVEVGALVKIIDHKGFTLLVGKA